MENEMLIVARHLQQTPIELDNIFADLGIGYVERRMPPGQSGWIERKGENYEIAINSEDPRVRQRFTAAHELGHYLLHRDLMEDGDRMNRHIDRLYGEPEDNPNSPFSSLHEVQANRMAAQILMPAPLVRDKFRDAPNLASLAKDFGVSQQAMEIRLKTLRLGFELVD